MAFVGREHGRSVEEARASRLWVLGAAWLLIIGVAISVHHARVASTERTPVTLEAAQAQLAAARRGLDATIGRRAEDRTSLRKQPPGVNDCGFPGVDLNENRRHRMAAASGHPLSKTDVVNGMNAVKPAVAECYRVLGVPGLAMVNVVIGKDGRITSATVTGKFAGTPTGRCVEDAVRGATFPPSDGLTTPYPFLLRP
jgi:hypothetical protein